MKTINSAIAALGLGISFVGAQALAQDTYFTDGSGTFSDLGEWTTQQFTVYKTTSFVMRFTADYGADYSIVKADQLDNFKNNRVFSGYGNFDDSFGTHAVVLGPGTYYAAVRNQVDGTNTYRWELDRKLVVPNFYLAANGISAAKYVSSNGGTLWHKFNIVPGYRYYIDGCNTGMETECIPAAELSKWQAEQSHLYYPDYSGSTTDQPGHFRLLLARGGYYFAFRNNASDDKALTYAMKIYRRY